MSSFPAGMSLSEPDGVTPIVKCMVITASSVKHHTKIRIFSFSGWPEKCFLKKGEKKEYMLHCVSQELILIVAIPEITPETRILIYMSANYQKKRKVSYPG